MTHRKLETATAIPMTVELKPKRGFDWSRVQWGGPKDIRTRQMQLLRQAFPRRRSRRRFRSADSVERERSRCRILRRLPVEVVWHAQLQTNRNPMKSRELVIFLMGLFIGYFMGFILAKMKR